MALSKKQSATITEMVNVSLNEAEATWGKHGEELEKALAESTMVADSAMVRKAERIPSKIPNHTNVSSEHSTVDEFIALVADMRKSSEHLLCDIANTRSDVTQLKRVYFETAALLPALELTVGFMGGSVTEYLGDGILALFPVDEATRGETVKQAYRAARNCVEDTRFIVNNELYSRYRLPDLDIGVGLGYSKAIVQLVGVPENRHAKAVGKCVYYASKLSCGVNVIYADKALHNIWPISKGGKLSFRPKALSNGVTGYQIDRE
jgi:class 3 adenylate cyclase